MSGFRMNNDYFLLEMNQQKALISSADVRYIVPADEALLIENITVVTFDQCYFPLYHFDGCYQLQMGRGKSNHYCLVLNSGENAGAALACKSLRRLSYFQPPIGLPVCVLGSTSPFTALIQDEGQWYPLLSAVQLLSLLEMPCNAQEHYPEKGACAL